MVELASYKTTTEAITVSSTTTGAAANVLYTCPLNHNATIDALMFNNNNASAKKVNVQLFHKEAGSYKHILKAHSIAANSTYNLLNNSHLHLHSGDIVVVHGETTNTIEATISVRERYNPNR